MVKQRCERITAAVGGAVAIALRTRGGTGTAKEIMEEIKTRQPQQREGETKEMKEDGGVVYERTAPGGG